MEKEQIIKLWMDLYNEKRLRKELEERLNNLNL